MWYNPSIDSARVVKRASVVMMRRDQKWINILHSMTQGKALNTRQKDLIWKLQRHFVHHVLYYCFHSFLTHQSYVTRLSFCLAAVSPVLCLLPGLSWLLCHIFQYVNLYMIHQYLKILTISAQMYRLSFVTLNCLYGKRIHFASILAATLIRSSQTLDTNNISVSWSLTRVILSYFESEDVILTVLELMQ